jgi:hypothetical protein
LNLPLNWLQAMVWVVALTTVASGIDYVWVWSRRAADYKKHH